MRAEAGAVWDDVVVTSLAHGLGGLECLSGIPGSAGATPVQNVGAYGAEVADTIRRVRLLDRRTGEDRWVAPTTLQFGYRTSILKHSAAAIVLEVEFELDPDGRSAPLRYGELANALGAEPDSRVDPTRVREAVLSLRARKGMVLDESRPRHLERRVVLHQPRRAAGGVRAATEQCRRQTCPTTRHPTASSWPRAGSWSGRVSARATPATAPRSRLSTKHALAVTNRGGATTADVIALARAVRDGVRTTFGIELTPEPILIGAAL